MNETLAIIEDAVKTLKAELVDDNFEFQYSDMPLTIEVIDLNCKEEHEELDKIYTIFYSRKMKSFSLFFESSLHEKSTFRKEHAAELIEADIDFEIYKQRLHLAKEDVALEELAKNVNLMTEILFNF